MPCIEGSLQGLPVSKRDLTVILGSRLKRGQLSLATFSNLLRVLRYCNEDLCFGLQECTPQRLQESLQ
jgi:hypothetical protein